MPKLTPNDKELADRIVRSCISSNKDLYAIDNEKLALKMMCHERTVRNRLDSPGDFSLAELRAVAKTLKFTPLQCASIIMGRTLTSKEVKEFLML